MDRENSGCLVEVTLKGDPSLVLVIIIKITPVQHGIQNSLKSTGPGRLRIWAAQNLKCHSLIESWSPPCQGWTDLMGTARGTSHPSRPWPSWPKVPAGIVPRAGPTAEVIKVKPAASQLFIPVLLQTSEEKLETGRRWLSQPSIYEVPSHSRVCSAISSPSKYSLSSPSYAKILSFVLWNDFPL